jgi:hypothetical protein
MNSGTTNQGWKPTLTLARLFEQQNQFYDALAIYELLSQTEDSPAIREKIEDLQGRILNDPNMHYDNRIEQLFSPEELAYLKIMNHSAFENLSRMRNQFAEGTPGYEIDIDDEILADKPTVSTFELRRMVDEIDTLAEHKDPEPLSEPETTPSAETEKTSSKVSDLAEEIVKRFGKDADLNSVSVQEFMQVVMKHNLKEKNNKQE